jgi:hypothetical protein
VPPNKRGAHVPVKLCGGLRSPNRIVTLAGITQHSVWPATPQAYRITPDTTLVAMSRTSNCMQSKKPSMDLITVATSGPIA